MRPLPAIASAVSETGVLQIGGVPVDLLAERVGGTPFFAYDRAALTARVGHLRSSLPDDIDLSYAIKANPMPAVVQHLSQLVDSFDVASAGEMLVALDTLMPPARVSFAGPGKTPIELRQAIAAGLTIELESRTEAERVASAGRDLRLQPRVAVRVNPDFQVKGSGMRMSGGPQQFGIDAEAVPEFLVELDRKGLDVLGFHVFAGSQNLHAETLCEAQRQTVALILDLADASPQPTRYVNLGGGFGIPYFPKDTELDLETVADNLARLMDEVLRRRLPEARVIIELGRYIVGECGVYVTRVLDRKVSRGRTFLVVDGGLHHQLAASGNFGQVIRRNYPVAVANRMVEPPTETASVVGCLCTPLDLLGDELELPEVQIGDLIAIFQAGAYGLTASPTAFLGHPSPTEVLV
jgi:diaminopimelate decarboxylase